MMMISMCATSQFNVVLTESIDQVIQNHPNSSAVVDGDSVNGIAV